MLQRKMCVCSQRISPGAHGQGRQKISEYGLQLREKQKARRIYGVLEKQFRRYFKEADRRKGVTGETLLQILESRLDNMVYRMGLARSRTDARQLIRHGHYSVNGRKVDIPSYLTKPEMLLPSVKKQKQFLFKEMAEWGAAQGTVEWLEVDRENMSGTNAKIAFKGRIRRSNSRTPYCRALFSLKILLIR